MHESSRPVAGNNQFETPEVSGLERRAHLLSTHADSVGRQILAESQNTSQVKKREAKAASKEVTAFGEHAQNSHTVAEGSDKGNQLEQGISSTRMEARRPAPSNQRVTRQQKNQK